MVKEGPWRPREVPRTGGGGENRRQGLGDLGVTAKRGSVALSTSTWTPSAPAQASITGLSWQGRKSWKPSNRALRGLLCPPCLPLQLPGLSFRTRPTADDWKQSSWSALPGSQAARIYSLLGGKRNYLECALEVGN